MVLISQFVKPGSKDLIDNYNHFSFLATVEKLFGLDAAGYAKNATPFDPSVFNGG